MFDEMLGLFGHLVWSHNIFFWQCWTKFDLGLTKFCFSLLYEILDLFDHSNNHSPNFHFCFHQYAFVHAPQPHSGLEADIRKF